MDTLKQIALSPPLSSHSKSHDYIIGLRGLLTLSSFLYIFLVVFAPAAVAHSQNATSTPSSTLHKILKFFSILFWNEGIIYSGFILLSARTIALPFIYISKSSEIETLLSPRLSIVGSVFRRGIRLWVPIAISLAISVGVFHGLGYEYVNEFAENTGNLSILVPYKINNVLVWFNSAFQMFWVTQKYSEQSASFAFPGQMLWVVNVVYMQSFTIYMTMVIIPYTRRSWRVKGAIFFIITAWWVQSWAWYSITGLLLADMVTNMDFKVKAQRGIKLYNTIYLPSYVPYACILASGLIMQYLWTAWRPQYQDQEIIAHGGLYYTGGLNEDFDVNQPQARDDNYLVLLGLMLIVETNDLVQYVLANRVFVSLGRRSLSFFLTHCIITYTLGIKLYTSLHLAHNASIAVCFFVCFATSVVGAEIFYRCIEVPSHVLSHMVFEWIRE
ncbi:hypothetical protein K491DRAFT_714146 [Lophiostoma macrostomum CBS 122681]|uniref:Acyltransferase 3 domain-containing protein n=1 Tax=Lophiostoma macrostomum CBS 122681 TaxID=1314788 RepID=A0A6A6TGW0_9PLEO|nr:hypothetical protein K491DRAFT_714146 [Lophiostoma macrostomum CBS 122681]